MDTETREIYETYFELFSSPGWKLFVSDLEESIEEFSNLLSIKDSKELHQRQGHIQMIERVIGMPDMMEYAFQQALEETDSDA